MNYIGKFISNFRDFYNEINAATLTGAIDVVVVRQEDGSYLSSPFHVRFGKMGVLRSREKVVDIEINGEPVDIHMKLGDTGEAFFVQEIIDEVQDTSFNDNEECQQPPGLLDSEVLQDEEPHDPDHDANYLKSDEEARSQDSGFEAEDPIPPKQAAEAGVKENKAQPPKTLKLRIKVDEDCLVADSEKDDSICNSVIKSVVSASTSTCTSSDLTSTVIQFPSEDVNNASSDAASLKVEECNAEGKSSDKVVEKSNEQDQSEDRPWASEIGVVTRVPRQDSSKFIMINIQTQTEKEFKLVEVKSTDVRTRVQEDKQKDSSSAEESPVKPVKKSPSDALPKESSKTAGGGAGVQSKSTKTDGEDGTKGSRNQRRKRRRRLNHKQQQHQLQQQQQQQQHQSKNNHNKKKGSSGSQSSDASTTSEVADLASLSGSAKVDVKDDGVFAMDDIVVRPSPAKDIRQSSSMPQLREAPVAAAALPTSLSAGLVEALPRQWGDQEVSVIRKISCSDMGPNLHPFSDTDISPPPSPGNTRPSTPIKSDTEFEVSRQRQEMSGAAGQGEHDETWNWTWGQLPTPPVKTTKPHFGGGHTADGEDKQEVPEGGVASAGEPLASGGDQAAGSATVVVPVAETEAAAAAKKEEEAQRSMFSGMLSFMRATKKARHNPQSEGIYLEDLNPDDLDPEVAALYFPKFSHTAAKRSVPIPVVDGPKDEDLESGNGPSLPQSPHSGGEGELEGQAASLDSDVGHEDALQRHPIFDYKGYHDLAFSLCGRLPELLNNELPESLFLQTIVTYDDFCADPTALLANPNLVVRLGGSYYNWTTALPHLMALALFQRPLPEALSQQLVSSHMPKKEEELPRKRTPSRGLSWFGWRRSTADSAAAAGATTAAATAEEPSTDTVEVTAAETQTSTPGSPSKGTTLALDSDNEDDTPRRGNNKRSLRLTTDQIKELNLHDGFNEVHFSVTTAYQGTTRCKCRIFLWNYDEKIIVSDIDGTITKSDVLGHIMPIIGRDWAQGGVAQLFTKIKNNGYHFLYLSARAIGHARITRDYLRSVVQEDVSLPDGPLLLNPTSLLQAFHREVIERNPEEFKISCLRDIQALFPKTSNPFYAGYGNKVNDVWAYCAVGIPISRVFTINHKGELKHELTQTFQSTYSNLSDIVHHMFPVYSQEMLHHGEYSSMRFWRQPMPDVDEEIRRLLRLPSPTTSHA